MVHYGWSSSSKAPLATVAQRTRPKSEWEAQHTRLAMITSNKKYQVLWLNALKANFFTVSISFCATVSLLVSVLSHVLVVQKMLRDILSGIFGLQWGWNGKLETVIGERGCVGRKQMHTWPIVNSALAVCKKVISCLSSWYSCALCFIIALSSGRTGTLCSGTLCSKCSLQLWRLPAVAQERVVVFHWSRRTTLSLPRATESSSWCSGACGKVRRARRKSRDLSHVTSGFMLA